MDDLCRLCANRKPFNRLTIRLSDSILNVEEKLIACCQWDSYKHDDVDLPDVICCDCYERLQECWIFSESIASAQEKLRRILMQNIGTASVKNELKTEENEFDRCEAESENLNISEELITLPTTLVPLQPAKPSDDSIHPTEPKPMRNFTCEVKKSHDLTEHLENSGEQQTRSDTNSEPTENQHELKYACDECGRRFRWRGNRDAHRLVHSKERRFECWLCHKTYKRKHELRYHIGTHSKLFDCGKCGKRFLKNSKRNNHMEKRHGIMDREKRITTLKQFTCELCGIGYCHREGLSRHLQTAHSDNNWPHKCEVCGKGFKIQNGLYQHRKSHSEIRHKCRQCDKSFRKIISLRRHMEYHTGSIKKPFVCDFCGKSFRLNCNLVEHRRIHTGEMPFSCEHCPSTFRTMSSFYSHLRKEHGISVSARKQEERTRAAARP